MNTEKWIQAKKDLDNKVIICQATLVELINEGYLAATGQEKLIVPDWQECERISDIQPVHEAMFVFAEDPTADNATGLVRAIFENAGGKSC